MCEDTQRMRYSVIIPAYDEGARIAECLANVRAVMGDVEAIVCDGGSSDATAGIAASCGAKVLTGERGRGVQCNAGAAVASGEVLLFLHADTRLPDGSRTMLEGFFRRSTVELGTFRLAFDLDHWFLSICGFMTRYDSVFTRFGDQCIVVRRRFFDELGGFPPWPLFEDVHFLARSRRITRIHSFPLTVTTSARRFIGRGVVRQQCRNAVLIIRYLLGETGMDLAKCY